MVRATKWNVENEMAKMIVPMGIILKKEQMNTSKGMEERNARSNTRNRLA